MRRDDSFRLITEDQASFLLGLIAAGLFVYDVINRLLERFG